MRSGWVGGVFTDEKGGPGKGGIRTPDPPSGHAPEKHNGLFTSTMTITSTQNLENCAASLKQNVNNDFPNNKRIYKIESKYAVHGQ